MTKAKIERLIELEKIRTCDNLDTLDAIELGRLRQEFETWTPEEEKPAPEAPVLSNWETVHGSPAWMPAPSTYPGVDGSPPILCTCSKPWWGVTPPPPCPVHGGSPRYTVTCDQGG